MKKSEILNKVLTAKDKAEILKFIENKAMMEVVKKVLLYDIYYAGTLKRNEDPNPVGNSTFSLVANHGTNVTNAQLGEVLRAQWEGLQYLEIGFQELGKFKIEKEKRSSDKENPAV